MFKFILPRFIFRMERWKWNKEYRVYVSNMGHFMDKYKKIIPAKINKSGYVIIKTSYGFILAHRLVMHTWRHYYRGFRSHGRDAARLTRCRPHGAEALSQS